MTMCGCRIKGAFTLKIQCFLVLQTWHTHFSHFTFTYYDGPFIDYHFYQLFDFPLLSIFIRNVPWKLCRKLVFLLFFHIEENSEPGCLQHIAAFLVVVYSSLHVIHYMLLVQLGHMKWFRSIYLNTLMIRALQKTVTFIF